MLIKYDIYNIKQVHEKKSDRVHKKYMKYEIHYKFFSFSKKGLNHLNPRPFYACLHNIHNVALLFVSSIL